MSDVMEGAVSFDNQAVKVNENRNFEDKPVLRFRPETNKVYRIKFTSPKVEMRRRHYNPIVTEGARYFRCLDHLGYCPICVAASKGGVYEGKRKLKGSSETFGANILVYDTNDEGELKSPLNAEVNFWAFGSDKFVALRGIQQDWGPLENLDLKVTCTDGQFQKVTITPLPKCAYAQDEAFKAACDKKIKEDSYPLDKFLCKEVPLIEMCKVFGLNVNEWVPAELLNQIPANQPTAQTVAAQQTPAQYPSQAIPGSIDSELPFGNTPAPAQQAVPQQAAPVQDPKTPIQKNDPPAEGFAGMDDLMNLLN